MKKETKEVIEAIGYMFLLATIISTVISINYQRLEGAGIIKSIFLVSIYMIGSLMIWIIMAVRLVEIQKKYGNNEEKRENKESN